MFNQNKPHNASSLVCLWVFHPTSDVDPLIKPKQIQMQIHKLNGKLGSYLFIITISYFQKK